MPTCNQKWMSHVTSINWVMSHVWMSIVTHMNESSHTHEWVKLSHTWMSKCGVRQQGMQARFMWHSIWLIHVCHMNESRRATAEDTGTFLIWMRFGTYMNEPCYTNEWLIQICVTIMSQMTRSYLCDNSRSFLLSLVCRRALKKRPTFCQRDLYFEGAC